MARFVSPDEWGEIDLPETKAAEVSLNITVPFVIEKGYHDDEETYAQDDDDVVVRGPVYVGDEDTLDRHGELVDMSAIAAAWDGYKKNPVILYNHSKTYGVIGRMTDVEMGNWPGFDKEVPIGRAVIDGAEEDIVRKIRKGFLRSFSIGFMAKAAVKECKDKDDCYMRFTDIEWVETSVVDIPSSRDALFNVEKMWDVEPIESKSPCGCEEEGACSIEEEPEELELDTEERAPITGATRKALQNKVAEHNEKYGDTKTKRTNLRTLSAVYRRGVGAYQTNPGSVRPTVTSAEQWAMARVNSFLYALRNGRFRSGKHDTDLLPEGHPMSSKDFMLDEINERAPYDDINFSPPEGVKAELRKGLKWHEEGHSGDGLVAATVSWARRMANGEDISPEKAVKMRAWLARHAVDKQGEGFSPGEDGYPSPGRVAWALWGGDPAVGWSNKLVKQMEAADERSLGEIEPETKAEHFDHSLTLSEEQMRTLHTEGMVYIPVTDGDQTMLIQLLYEGARVEESIKYPFSESETISEETKMTEEQILNEEIAETTEEVVESNVPVVEEVKTTETENLPSPTEVMMAVAASLSNIEQRLASVETFMANFNNEEELKSVIATHESTIETLTAEKAKSEEELRIAAEVESRVKAALANMPEPTPTPTPEAVVERKTTVESVKEAPTRAPLDPAIKVSPGMNGLASWLEGRLSNRGGAN